MVDKNKTIDGNVYGVAYAESGAIIHQEINIPQHKTPKLLTSTLGQATNIIGREKELKEIDNLLKTNNPLLLINGIGGVGKSTLVSYYLYSEKDNYDYYGFFKGLDSFVGELSSRLDLKEEKEQEAFMEALTKLSSLEGSKLLIIDDVTNIEENKDKIEKILALEASNYKILFSSRNIINGIDSYSLGTLILPDAKKLFFKYCETHEIKKVEKVLDYLDCHALFVELVAKTINSNIYNFDKIIKSFDDNKLSKIEFIDVENGKVKQFNQTLEKLFSLQALDEEYILLLKKLSTLPPIDIELVLLEDIFKTEHLKARLDFLVNRGWLISNGNVYKLHQVIKEYILNNHLPLFSEIEEVFLYFYETIEKINIQTAKEYINKLDYFDSMFHVLLLIKDRKVKRLSFLVDIFKFKVLKRMLFNLNFTPNIDNLDMREIINKRKGIELQIKYFFCSFGSFYRDLGYYNKALFVYQKGLDISQIIYKKNNLEIATCANNLADQYHSMGEYKKAEEFYLKSLQIKEKILGEEHLDTINSYDNLAVLYESMKAYKEAEQLYLKALNIKEKILGVEQHNIAYSYNNLASLYQAKKAYKKAEFFYLKGLEIWKKELGEENLDTAAVYSNLAGLYQLMEMYEVSEKLHKKGLKISKKILRKEHPTIATGYYNLALLYGNTGEYEKAELLYLKALKIFEKVLPEGHPDLIKSKEGLDMIKSELDKKI